METTTGLNERRIARIETELTEELLGDALVSTRARLRRFRARICDDATCHDVVGKLITDVFAGTLVWPCERCTFRQFFFMSLKVRCFREAARQRRWLLSGEVPEEHASASQLAPFALESAAIVREELAQVMKMMDGYTQTDAAAALILIAFQDGIFGGAELRRATDLSQGEIDAALKRIRRYLDKHHPPSQETNYHGHTTHR